MSHWAEIGPDSRVIRVIVGNNDEPDEGYSWIVSRLGGTWVQTSYHDRIRGKFAAIGDRYDAEQDLFIDKNLEG